MTRPQIVCHMIASLDGRLLADRWPASEAALLETYDGAAERLGAEGWIAGRRTMEHYVPTGEPAAGGPAAQARDRIADRRGRRLAIGFDRSGRLRPESGDLDGDHLVIVMSERVSEAHVSEIAARGVSVVLAGPDGNAVAGALARIGAAFGVRRLLLEGGGTLNGAFVAAGLVDETSTLIWPVLDGQRGVPAIYDRDAATTPTALEAISAELLPCGTVWLRHRVVTG
ncbi:dihydrofolate reductase family protein [Poseidonocella sp. HB161398]|uniref:RibD family protein n=1 Tax=Poseidonocella sp. HB161398 TaxID=2320855 RepID=UPI0011082470|nr:dihydrofolate reductase family protein [Poseidonocella sp. HB161398]